MNGKIPQLNENLRQLFQLSGDKNPIIQQTATKTLHYANLLRGNQITKEEYTDFLTDLKNTLLLEELADDLEKKNQLAGLLDIAIKLGPALFSII